MSTTAIPLPSSSSHPNSDLPMRDQVKSYIYALQSQIVSALESIPDPFLPPYASPLQFNKREWTREEGGGGIAFTTPASPSSLLDVNSNGEGGGQGNGGGGEGGEMGGWLEKGCVNVSMIDGMLSPPVIRQMSTEHAELRDEELSKTSLPFFAGGISIILHPRNPNVPSVHANYRYMEITTPVPSPSPSTFSDPSSSDPSLSTPPQIVSWWFGAVTDLTPTYTTNPHQFTHFHTTLKSTLDAHSPILYPAFKKSCDDYFYIPHRKEWRGMGGVRFDNLSEGVHPYFPDDADGVHESRPKTKEELFSMLKSLGDAFLPSYLPILIDVALAPSPTLGLSSLATPWTERQKRWQLLRRGRSIEFTLIYERGTKFGLAAKGVNVENVLASMPERAGWEYQSELGSDWDKEGGDEGEGAIGMSEEGKMVRMLKGKPREWAG